MATVTITIPDAIVPDVLVMFRAQYPDVAALTDTAVGKEGIARILRTTFQNWDMSRTEKNLQAQVSQARTDRLAAISPLLSQIV